MCPDGLDRARHLDPAPVELGPSGGAHRLRDVGRADRAEQAPAVAGLDGQPDVQRGEPARGLLGVVQATDVPGRARPLDQVNLLFRTTRPAHGEAAGDQVVAAVTAGHLHHVTWTAQAGDLLGEDQLHRRATHRQLSFALPRRARVGEHRHLPRVLDGGGDVALVLGAVAGYPPRPDLAAVGDELPQQRGVLVVDVGDLLLAEQADFLSWLTDGCFRHRGAPG